MSYGRGNWTTNQGNGAFGSHSAREAQRRAASAPSRSKRERSAVQGFEAQDEGLRASLNPALGAGWITTTAASGGDSSERGIVACFRSDSATQVREHFTLCASSMSTAAAAGLLKGALIAAGRID